MIPAVGASPGPSTLPTTGDAGGLQAQLSQAQRQLADCINCDTADTPSGKAKIQVLTARVQILKDRLEEVETSRRAQPPSPVEGPRFPVAGQGVALPSVSLGSGLDISV